MKETIYYRMLLALVRHGLSKIAGIIVTIGWINAEMANEFTTTAALEITAGIFTFLVSLYLSYKDKVWEFLKTKVGIAMPPNTTMETVAKVALTVENKKAVAMSDETIETPPSVHMNQKDGGV